VLVALLIMLHSLGFFDQFPAGKARSISAFAARCFFTGIQALEIFAGASVVTRVLRSTGLRTAALDIAYWPSYKVKKARKGQKAPSSNLVDLMTPAGFITAVLAVLGCDEAHIVVVAIVCSSWVSISRGTTKRTWLSPLGDPSVESVRMGNVLASRPGIKLLFVWRAQESQLMHVA
ncbi:unnamed protein product, partial [Durusdinium trenchii]